MERKGRVPSTSPTAVFSKSKTLRSPNFYATIDGKRCAPSHNVRLTQRRQKCYEFIIRAVFSDANFQ